MADTNMTPKISSEATQNREVQKALLAKVAAIVETAKCHTQACVLALTLAVGGAAHADEPIVLASAENGTPSGAQGEVIDSSLNATQIQNQILATQSSIAELEAKDVLTGADRRDIYLLKKELIELENQKQALENSTQAEQTAVIEAENNKQDINTEAMENLEEISSQIKW